MLETKCQENARAIAQQIKKSGGGSGSEVTVTQVLASGTKIATIKVDDDSTDIYCETVPATYDADDIVYDNTTSGLTATDAQAAIDEVVQAIPADAADLSYDNTTSGLTATNVQDAIDEVAQGGGGGGGSWTLVDTVTGTTAINIPATAKEILVKGILPSGKVMTSYLPVDVLSSTSEIYINGGSIHATSFFYMGFNVSTTTVSLQTAIDDSAGVTNTSTVKLYAR